jgi:Nucleoporin complex subunit 54
MVTWGANTVHNIGPNATAAPAASSFSLASAPPLGTSLWNSAPPPSAPMTPPANTFASSSAMFATSNPTAPAQAAYQAHQDAQARNEQTRVLQRMQSLYAAYTGTTVVEADRPSHCFSMILYEPKTTKVAMSIWGSTSIWGNTSHAPIPLPPRPPSINTADWNVACLRTPEHASGPVAVVGADGLQARVLQQQAQSQRIGTQHLVKLQAALELWQQRQAQVQRALDYSREQHRQQCRRLGKIMKKMEVLRCYRLPLQDAELDAYARMRQLRRVVEEQLVPAVVQVAHPEEEPRALAASTLDRAVTVPSWEQQQALRKLMTDHRAQITLLTRELQEPDWRDLQLLRDRVLPPSHTDGTTKTSRTTAPG